MDDWRGHIAARDRVKLMTLESSIANLLYSEPMAKDREARLKADHPAFHAALVDATSRLLIQGKNRNAV